MRKLATSTCVVAALALLAFAMPALTSAPASAKPPIVVDSNLDTALANAAASGECTLREAIGNAIDQMDNTDGDCRAGSPPPPSGKLQRIEFDLALPATITLGGTQLPDITDSVNIVGPGPAQLTIIVGGSFRHFRVTGGGN